MENYTITRTPLRISFVGGSSDLPVYLNTGREGAAVSATINKYMRTSVADCKLGYKIDGKHYNSFINIPNERIGECVFQMKTANVDIEVDSDVRQGSGLGASSALVVGLLRSLFAHRQMDVPTEKLVYMATEIEERLAGCGKQDVHGTATGGMKKLMFLSDGRVRILKFNTPVTNPFLLFDTGIKRPENIIDSVVDVGKIAGQVALVSPFIVAMMKHDIYEIGRILHEGWRLKRGTAKRISSYSIDIIYERALAAGAIGGKVCGAGGGGFMLFCAEPERHQAIVSELRDLTHVPFEFVDTGVEICKP